MIALTQFDYSGGASLARAIMLSLSWGLSLSQSVAQTYMWYHWQQQRNNLCGKSSRRTFIFRGYGERSH